LKPALFRQDLIVLLDLLQQQKIKPRIAQRFPLAESRRAQELAREWRRDWQDRARAQRVTA
jgi:NADPH2:quinone reductase